MDYIFRLAYRHGNGEVEGFAAMASGSDKAKKATIAKAREKAVAKAREKASWTPTPFDPARLIESETKLTAEERATVKADWVLEGYP